MTCGSTSKIIWTCGRNNTVNGERLEYLWPVPAGIGGKIRCGSRGGPGGDPKNGPRDRPRTPSQILLESVLKLILIVRGDARGA
jgi:hypothetical protein